MIRFRELWDIMGLESISNASTPKEGVVITCYNWCQGLFDSCRSNQRKWLNSSCWGLRSPSLRVSSSGWTAVVMPPFPIWFCYVLLTPQFCSFLNAYWLVVSNFMSGRQECGSFFPGELRLTTGILTVHSIYVYPLVVVYPIVNSKYCSTFKLPVIPIITIL